MANFDGTKKRLRSTKQEPNSFDQVVRCYLPFLKHISLAFTLLFSYSYSWKYLKGIFPFRAAIHYDQ